MHVKIAVVDPEPSARAERYLQAARETAHWLIRAAIDTPEGPGWPITPGRPETLNATLYGGGAGIALFLSDLASATADAGFARAARTLTTSGLPARRYPGFWDNVGQCCGSAGVADFSGPARQHSRSGTSGVRSRRLG